LLLSGAILAETALSYLGFGVRPPDVSLGLLISEYQGSFSISPWLFWWPGTLIISIALCINFIGDGLRDAFDPRQRRHVSTKERMKTSESSGARS
jgi:peptide/nickel transport system permease protein